MITAINTNQRITDNLVLGSGLAGLMLALKLAKAQKVLVMTKGSLQETNSYYAQGGIASVFDHQDSFEEHSIDTIQAGAGLCHKEVVDKIISKGPKAIADLEDYGVIFTKQETKEQAYHLTKEGGHSKRRVVHAKDATGQAIMTALMERVREEPNITLLEHHVAIDLITTDRYHPDFRENFCLGAYALDAKTDRIITVKAAKTFIATGGHGRLYLYTTNPAGATGDGLAMAWRAGCRIANLEFMQFHPTCLFHPKVKNFLISEALRGEGGILRDKEGHSFMEQYHKDGSLAPRDIVARAIDHELKKSGKAHVFLDITHLGAEKIKKLFPTIYQFCLDLDLDITKQWIPVVPAAHYSCGGIVIDGSGSTSIGRLYALGEAACSGLHGANRLASNSLLEACVLAGSVAEHVLSIKRSLIDVTIPDWDSSDTIPSDEMVILSHMWDEIRRIMWNYVGIVRSDARLQKALTRIETIKRDTDEYYWKYQVNKDLIEVRNLADVAWLTIKCAMRRKESRGIHYNIDYQEAKERYCHDTVLN